jgi:hypothetical protein
MMLLLLHFIGSNGIARTFSAGVQGERERGRKERGKREGEERRKRREGDILNLIKVKGSLNQRNGFIIM